MSRHGDWYSKLQAVVKAHDRAPWERGKRDCATFVADCLLAIGADDILAGLRGNYTNRVELLRQIAALGFRNPMEIATSWCDSHGYPEIEPMFAQCGDLGITNNDTVCIRMTSGFLAMAESGGICIVTPIKAWAIEWA